MLLLACQKGEAALFRQLAKHYAPHLKETEELWTEALANIGEIWFGIRIPRQGPNPLFGMMSNMMFGGGGQKKEGNTPRSGTPKPKEEEKPKPAVAAPPPPTMDLD